MIRKEYEDIEDKLIHLALHGDKDAGLKHSELQALRVQCTKTKSAEDEDAYSYALQGAHAWLAIHRPDPN
jgi:hypothetical protein